MLPVVPVAAAGSGEGLLCIITVLPELPAELAAPGM